MDILLISRQPLLVRSFQAYSRCCLRKLRICTPDVPDKPGLSAVLIDAKYMHIKTLRKIIRQHSDVPVFILMSAERKPQLFGVEGVAGVFLQGISKRKLIQAIELFLKDKAPKSRKCMSIKETIILDYLSTGQSDKEIAIHLGVPLSTVKYHVRKLFKKLEVSNRTEAALIAPEISV